MTDETLDLEPQSQPAPEPLRWITHDNGDTEVCVGRAAIATDCDDQWARMGRFAARMPNRMASLAWIGAGTCVGPRICRGRMSGTAKQDIYELRPRLIDRLKLKYPVLSQGWNFISGDYRTTLTGTYDVIVYDIGDTPDSVFLRSHLNPGGLLLGVEA